MRKQYVKPSIANYGLCKTLIQGSCGWGVENLVLDKTGYSQRTYYKWVAQPCAGPDPKTGKTNCYSLCSATSQCSNTSIASKCTKGATKKI